MDDCRLERQIRSCDCGMPATAPRLIAGVYSRLCRRSACMRMGLAALLLAVLAVPGQAEDKKAKVNFQDHVLPIFRAKCGTCHGADQAKGGLVLESYSAAMQGGASGAVVEPGDLDGSRLWELVSHSGQPSMPPKENKLPDETLAVIRNWIDGGALENANSKPKIKKKSQFTLNTANVSAGKPEGPPPMPENLSVEPLTVSPRGNAVTALAASPWAPLVAVAGYQQVLLYDMTDFTLAAVLPFPEGTIHVLRFSRNGTLLLAGGGRGGLSGRVIVFDVKTGKRVFEIGDEADLVLAADISANHSRIALGGPKKMVRVYSTADGALLYESKKHTDWITSIEFSPDDVLLATGDRSNGLIVWEAGTGREFYVLNGHTAMITGLSWRIDGNLLASCSEDGSVRLWEMNNGKQVKSWGAHGGGTESVWFLRDGHLVTTGRDKSTKLWDQGGKQVRAFSSFTDLGLQVTFAETSGMVVAGDWTGAVRIWDMKDGRELANLASNPPALATRLAEATQLAATTKAASDQAAGRLAALQKAEAGKQAAAAAAQKKLAEAQAAAKTAVAAKPVADKALAEKVAAEKSAGAAVTKAEAAVKQAKTEKAAAEKAEDKKDVPAKTEALAAAEKALTAAQQAQAAAAAAKKVAEKAVAEAAAKIKATAQQVPAAKTAADKAVAAAKPTPAITKALAEAATKAQQAAELAQRQQAVVVKLKAQKSRPQASPSTASK